MDGHGQINFLYHPEQVLWAGPSGASRSSRQVQQLLVQAGIPVSPAQPGQALDLGAGARLQLLAAGSRGVILLLEWQHFRALLPLGADFTNLDTLGQSRAVGPVSALLLVESGYAPAMVAGAQPIHPAQQAPKEQKPRKSRSFLLFS